MKAQKKEETELYTEKLFGNTVDWNKLSSVKPLMKQRFAKTRAQKISTPFLLFSQQAPVAV